MTAGGSNIGIRCNSWKTMKARSHGADEDKLDIVPDQNG
jgi:hypothetical protein